MEERSRLLDEAKGHRQTFANSMLICADQLRERCQELGIDVGAGRQLLETYGHLIVAEGKVLEREGQEDVDTTPGSLPECRVVLRRVDVMEPPAGAAEGIERASPETTVSREEEAQLDTADELPGVSGTAGGRSPLQFLGERKWEERFHQSIEQVRKTSDFDRQSYNYALRYLLQVLTVGKLVDVRTAGNITAQEVLEAEAMDSWYRLRTAGKDIPLTEKEYRMFCDFGQVRGGGSCPEINFFVHHNGSPVKFVSTECLRGFDAMEITAQNMTDARRYLESYVESPACGPEEAEAISTYARYAAGESVSISSQECVDWLVAYEALTTGDAVVQRKVSGTDTDGWEKLSRAFPVSTAGSAPTAEEVRQATCETASARRLVAKWKYEQTKLQQKAWLGRFRAKQPTLKECEGALRENKSWKVSASSLRSQWVAAERRGVSTKDWHRHLFRDGKSWPGLVVRQTEARGKSLVAAQRFSKYQVVCDYHGKAVRARADYWKMLENTSYLLSFRHGGFHYHIDASKDDGSYGRLINHSRKRPNVKPRTYEDGSTGSLTVYFEALRDIEFGEELLYDYGDMGSFGDDEPEWMVNS